MSKLPIKAISVADARLRLRKLKPQLANLNTIYNELVELETNLGTMQDSEDLSQLLEARNKVTLKEDEIIDLQDLFLKQDCVIKDVATGLIDFIAVRQGKPVWLCYKFGEEELEYYHDWEAGFKGRKLIDFQ